LGYEVASTFMNGAMHEFKNQSYALTGGKPVWGDPPPQTIVTHDADTGNRLAHPHLQEGHAETGQTFIPPPNPRLPFSDTNPLRNYYGGNNPMADGTPVGPGKNEGSPYGISIAYGPGSIAGHSHPANPGTYAYRPSGEDLSTAKHYAEKFGSQDFIMAPAPNGGRGEPIFLKPTADGLGYRTLLPNQDPGRSTTPPPPPDGVFGHPPAGYENYPPGPPGPPEYNGLPGHTYPRGSEYPPELSF
jgi:hypothetical protein